MADWVHETMAGMIAFLIVLACIVIIGYPMIYGAAGIYVFIRLARERRAAKR